MTKTREYRIKELCDHVASDHRYVWGAYDQGRYAFHTGGTNNFHHCSWHVNYSEWQRGFDAEAAYWAEQVAA